MKTYLSILVSLILVPAYSQVATQVYTPKGSLVQDTYINNEEHTPYDVAYIAQQMAIEYPQATILDKATKTYNCHAYAWHMTEGGKAVWMGKDTDPTSIYWTDGSYVETTSGESGLKVSYGYVNHSAVTTAENDVFISKWGKLPLVKHRKDYGPYPSTDLKYYKRPAFINLSISGPASLHKPGLSGTYTANYANPNIEWWLRKDNGNSGGAIRVATGSQLVLQCVKAGSILPFALDNETLLNENDNIYEPQSNIEDQVFYFLYARHGNVTSSTLRIQAGGELRAITPYLLNAETNNSIAYPNPASNVLNIDLDQQIDALRSTTTSNNQFKQEKTYDIRLYNGQGNLSRQAKTKSGSGKVEFNITNLPNGIYYLHIYDNLSENPEIKKIIIKH